MSLPRAVKPMTSSSNNLLRLAASAASPATRKYPLRPSSVCLRCQIGRSARRSLSTATAYRPHTLDTVPPPPRNSNIPHTSIAGISPEVNNTRPPRLTGQYGQTTAISPRPGVQSISETEQEAQKSKPIAQQATTSQDTDTASTSKPKRPSKLRARKAAMNLTPTATAQIRNLLSLPEPKFIRIGVKNKGCSGLTYHLEYVDKAGKFDEAVEQDGVKVLIDSKALFSIIGSEMDWVEDKLNQRFVFNNPNIKEQCGCGESFMV